MNHFTHPSERDLGGRPEPASRFIREGCRCQCFSSSSAHTSTATTDYQAAAQGSARISTGTENRMATDNAVQLANTQGDTSVNGGTLVKAAADLVTGTKLGNLGNNNTVNVTTDAPALAANFASALSNLTAQSGAQLGQIVKQNSDLTQASQQTFADATQAIKNGLSQTTISLLALGAVGVVALYIWRKK